MLLANLNPLFALPAAQLHKECFQFPWEKEAFESLFALKNIVCHMDSQRMIVCSHILDELEIYTICVHPKFQRQGLASELLDMMKSYAKEHKIKRIFLEVKSNNKPAIKLYRKKGFKRTGIRKNYYKIEENGKIKTCDALCMTLIIPRPYTRKKN